MTVVSLIAIIIQLSKAKSTRVTNTVKACSQAWDLLRFVDSIDCHLQGEENMDGFDTGTDEVSMAADKEFFRLQQLYETLSVNEQKSSPQINIEFAKNLYKVPEELLKTEKLLEDKCEKVQDLVGWAEHSLRNVIASCLSKMPELLAKQCRKWAEGFEDVMLHNLGLQLSLAWWKDG
ncbi:hypothetical protein KI387_030961 [Taxus chinensis]|uniref:Uncharacterized protein n=1 Tax=Taxus chinensis TaxID=29808 RepID=A0AA38CMN7_TAXCH|nr:hypothetical protein KI387_030961 [Taxus chinensis]